MQAHTDPFRGGKRGTSLLDWPGFRRAFFLVSLASARAPAEECGRRTRAGWIGFPRVGQFSGVTVAAGRVMPARNG